MARYPRREVFFQKAPTLGGFVDSSDTAGVLKTGPQDQGFLFVSGGALARPGSEGGPAAPLSAGGQGGGRLQPFGKGRGPGFTPAGPRPVSLGRLDGLGLRRGQERRASVLVAAVLG